MKTALLFDLDGTLVDSDPEHLVAFQRVFAPHGIELDHAEYAAKIMGASNAMIASRYLAHLSPVEQAATLDAKEVDTEKIWARSSPSWALSRCSILPTGAGSSAQS